MKLLFDENLSRNLPSRLAADLPGCTHVDAIRLGGRSDSSIWEYAGTNGYTIVSKDNDFRQRAFLYGPPPQVIWLSVGNAGTTAIAGLLTEHRQRIADFVERTDEGLLILRI